MKRFTIKRTARFERHFFSMPDRLGISKAQALEAVLEMKEAVAILEELGTLPPEYGYNLHQLEREPWGGFMEFHASGDVLVVYAEVAHKNVIRLLGIYNHALLASGKID